MGTIGQCFGHLPDFPQIGHTLLAMERYRSEFQNGQSIEDEIDGVRHRPTRGEPVQLSQMLLEAPYQFCLRMVPGR